MQCKFQGIVSSSFTTVQSPQAHMTNNNTTTANNTVLAQQQQQQQINTQQLINTNLENSNNSNNNNDLIYQQLSLPVPVKQEPGILIDYNGQTILTFNQQHQMHQQQQQQQLQPIQHNFQHTYYQPFNDSGLSLHDLNTFDDHILSPIKQNDPLLSNCTIYDENIIDTLN
jgi:hypothetical protein